MGGQIECACHQSVSKNILPSFLVLGATERRTHLGGPGQLRRKTHFHRSRPLFLDSVIVNAGRGYVIIMHQRWWL